MIKAIVTKKSGEYYRFECSGHAGFAKKGKDIVCASVSVLTTNTINSIESLTDTDFTGGADDGYIEWEFPNGCNKETQLLMDSLVLGLDQISNEYKNYLKLEIKEV